jgi:hypothetical protein
MQDKKMLTACSLWAHLAYLYKNVVPVQLNYRTVSTLLVSQIFLNVNYRFDAEVKAGTKAVKRKDQVEQLDEQLGFPQTEIFDLFQKHRRKVSHPTHQSILKFITSRPSDPIASGPTIDPITPEPSKSIQSNQPPSFIVLPGLPPFFVYTPNECWY